MSIIEDFIARYRREFDFYDQAARLVAQQLDQQMQASGIRAMVTSRAKSPERLLRKVEQRAPTHRYATVDNIYADIVDLAGARVSLYFPGERQEVNKIVRSQFLLVEPPKEFPASSNEPSYKKRFSGYWATHYRVQLNEKTLSEAQKRYVDARVEIQVASVLMLAWAEVEHDLVYKPLQGKLSEDEYAILDELNGLVLAGEIALERLQRAAEIRAGERGTSFANHYDLAAFLFEAVRPLLKGSANDAALGRVDVLFELLQRLELANPDALDPYIESLHADTERRPIAEQIIDQILAADDSRYATYTEIKSARKLPYARVYEAQPGQSVDSSQAIGLFISQWIVFERFVRELTSILQPDMHKSGIVPTTRRLAELEVFDKAMLFEMDVLRRLRNNLVHGVEVPDALYISEAADRLSTLLQELAQSPDESIRTAMKRAQITSS